MIGSNGPAFQRPPRVMVVLPGLFPSTYLGVLRPLRELHRTGAIELDLHLEWLLDRQFLDWADIVVFSRNENPRYNWVLQGCLNRGIPLIYDLDDNLLALDQESGSIREPRLRERESQIKEYLEGVDLIRVYSPGLREYLGSSFGEVVRAHGPVDWNLIPPATDRERGPLCIVYATSRLDDKLGDRLVEPIRRILADHEEVRFVVWGPRIEGLQKVRRVEHRGRTLNYERFFREFAASRFEIGLAPLAPDLFHKCKSNNKFREHAACGIAGIYSDNEVYREDVEHGRTGLLVGSSARAWVGAMSRLIRDEKLRRGIQKRAYALARERYSVERSSDEWLRDILAVLESSSPRRLGKHAEIDSSSSRQNQGMERRIHSVYLAARRLLSLVPRTWFVAREQPRQALERTRIHLYGAIAVRSLRRGLK